MDQIESLRVFMGVVEHQGLSAAADAMDLPRASVTKIIQRLETKLGATLLSRTARRIELTPDGLTLFERATHILAELDALRASVGSGNRSDTGLLRVEMGTTMAHQIILPALPLFQEAYPQIEITLGISDRAMEVFDEQVDCAIRVGDIDNEAAEVRKIGELEFATVAAPAYLEEEGTPWTPADLAVHRLLTAFSPRTGRRLPLRYRIDGAVIEVTGGAGGMSINDTTACVRAAALGLGIAQLPRFMVLDHLRAGTVVEILSGWRRPCVTVHLAIPRQRSLNKRAEIFSDWAAEQIAPYCIEVDVQPTPLHAGAPVSEASRSASIC